MVVNFQKSVSLILNYVSINISNKIMCFVDNVVAILALVGVANSVHELLDDVVRIVRNKMNVFHHFVLIKPRF